MTLRYDAGFALGNSRFARCGFGTGRLFFALTYDDWSFLRAAQTWQAEVTKEFMIGDGDQFISRKFSTEVRFKEIWAELMAIATRHHLRVVAGHVFCHAEVWLNWFGQLLNSGQFSKIGIEFKVGTLTTAEIMKLPRLPWDTEQGFLILAGCNTATDHGNGESTAKSFFDSQGVPVVGTLRFAAFSTNRLRFKEIDEDVKQVYLWSYHELSTADLSSAGSKMPDLGLRLHMRMEGKVFA